MASASSASAFDELDEYLSEHKDPADGIWRGKRPYPRVSSLAGATNVNPSGGFRPNRRSQFGIEERFSSQQASQPRRHWDSAQQHPSRSTAMPSRRVKADAKRPMETSQQSAETSSASDTVGEAAQGRQGPYPQQRARGEEHHRATESRPSEMGGYPMRPVAPESLLDRLRGKGTTQSNLARHSAKEADWVNDEPSPAEQEEEEGGGDDEHAENLDDASQQTPTTTASTGFDRSRKRTERGQNEGEDDDDDEDDKGVQQDEDKGEEEEEEEEEEEGDEGDEWERTLSDAPATQEEQGEEEEEEEDGGEGGGSSAREETETTVSSIDPSESRPKPTSRGKPRRKPKAKASPPSAKPKTKRNRSPTGKHCHTAKPRPWAPHHTPPPPTPPRRMNKGKHTFQPMWGATAKATPASGKRKQRRNESQEQYDGGALRWELEEVRRRLDNVQRSLEDRSQKAWPRCVSTVAERLKSLQQVLHASGHGLLDEPEREPDHHQKRGTIPDSNDSRAPGEPHKRCALRNESAPKRGASAVREKYPHLFTNRGNQGRKQQSRIALFHPCDSCFELAARDGVATFQGALLCLTPQDGSS